MISSYQDLTVWQRSIQLVEEIYKLTRQLPSEEKFGLASQMQRAAVSIPSNIAEGRYRGTKNDFVQFLRIAYGSGAELETQLLISKKLYPTNTINYTRVEELLTEVMKMLNQMVRNLNPKS